MASASTGLKTYVNQFRPGLCPGPQRSQTPSWRGTGSLPTPQELHPCLGPSGVASSTIKHPRKHILVTALVAYQSSSDLVLFS